MLYHVAFQICLAVNGGPETCVAEQVIDTIFFNLVDCYSGAKTVENMVLKQVKTKAKEQNVSLESSRTKTRCLDFGETEAFLKKNGPSSLMVTGKKYE